MTRRFNMIKDKYSSIIEFEMDVFPERFQQRKEKYLKEKEMKSFNFFEFIKY